MSAPTLNRRHVLRTGAAAAAALTLPHVRGAFAAGRLAVMAWDHAVPDEAKSLAAICRDWAAAEKVELTFDRVSSAGGRDELTLAAEAKARLGYDLSLVRMWSVAAHKDDFVAVDDLVEAAVGSNGPVAPGCEYLGKYDGHWRAVPTGYGSVAKPACARIDYLKSLAGVDLQAMYPGPGGAPDPALQEWWSWDNFLGAAEACAKGGHPFALGLSGCGDAVDFAGAVFAAFGARLVDESGAAAVDSDQTRRALDWFRRLAKTLPDAVYAYDDASNDQALVSGASALIFDAPGASITARRDAPAVGGQLWTLPPPKGPAGRFVPAGFAYWGIWSFSKNIPAAKALVEHLSSRQNQDRLAAAGGGFDIPPFAGRTDFALWGAAGSPAGTLYNYPPRDDAIAHVAGDPAPPSIAARLYREATLTRMIALCTREGKSTDEAIAWAEKAIAGLTRS